MLAVDCIEIMPVQAALRAGVAHLGGLEDGPRQLQEKSHADDHDEDGQQLAPRCGERDVAKTCRRQCGYREIEGVDIGFGACRVPECDNKDQRRHDENEDKKVHRREDCILMQPEKPTVAPQITDQVVGVDQPQTPKDTQKSEVIGENRREEKRGHHKKIGNCVEAQAFFPTVLRDPETCCKIQKDQDAESGVDSTEQPGLRPRDADDEVNDRQRVKADQRVAEPPCRLASSCIEKADGVMQSLHVP